MASFFCDYKLAGYCFGGLENRSGQYGKFYYPRKLPADGGIAYGRNFLAFIYSDFIIGSGIALDFRNHGFCLSASLGAGVYLEWSVDTGIVDYVGGIYVQEKTEGNCVTL